MRSSTIFLIQSETSRQAESRSAHCFTAFRLVICRVEFVIQVLASKAGVLTEQHLREPANGKHPKIDMNIIRDELTKAFAQFQ